MPVMYSAQNNQQKPILVFLAKDAACDIVSKLNENGYVAAAVSAVPELFDALRSDRYFLVVTMRSDIDMVRNIKPIPVINLEVFFHTVQSATKSVRSSKEFDSDAFLRRIAALTESRTSRIAVVQRAPAANEAVTAGKAKASRWRAATSLLLSRRAAPSAERAD
ncbi:hypothetical protein [Rhizobium leguminosarum]|uniref:Response regulatory domain-containing protein n=1 Tax=Rhizobium leguminosarum TaxID=384 RepID=A0A7M3DZZ8_RHILE|nr:hypothetical protein [Rhizobium leguminosarum]MDI5926860.1 hypothetical protein [Rhizobium leguminosarum]MDV4163071.1 hypothetical protein [Rhizobium leguminosarum]MDV4174893.1 hypothetical protein [Rhizobium leguminosarum]NKK43656.1 hypothetical protein [Rhizobium leguminosarum bv. viciae]TAY54214.1 hypothetical protein ELH90_22555 [Rhizobium leguminosarum]